MKMPISDIKFACITYLVRQEMAGLDIDWMHPSVQACGREAYGDLGAYVFEPCDAKQLGYRIRKRRTRIMNFCKDLVIREADDQLIKRIFTTLDDGQVEMREYVVVSEGQVPGILQEYHNNNGHPGMNKTYDLIKHIYLGMSLDMVRIYIHDCLGCRHIYVPPKPRNFYGRKKIKIESLGEGSLETDGAVDVWVEGQFECMDELIEAQTATSNIQMAPPPGDISNNIPMAPPPGDISNNTNKRELFTSVKSDLNRTVSLMGHTISQPAGTEASIQTVADDEADNINVSSSLENNYKNQTVIGLTVPAVARDITIESVVRQQTRPRRKIVDTEHNYHTAEELLHGQDWRDHDDSNNLDRFLMICLRDQPTSSAMKWPDFYGVDEAKQCLEEYVIWPKKYPNLLKDINHNKGLLLCGCSGSGKTSLVKALGARAKCKLFAISSQLLIRDSIMDTMKVVQLLFILARQRSQAIVFIDDIEKVKIDSSTPPQSPIRGVLPMLGEQLENLVHTKDLYVICATTSTDGLDESLLKKLQVVPVPLPDDEARKCILDKWLTNAPLYGDLVGTVVTQTEGFTGDQVADLAHEILLGHARNSILKQNTSRQEIIVKAVAKIKK